MAIGGGKLGGGATKGRIHAGVKTDNGKFGERPLKDTLAAESAEPAKHLYLDMKTGGASSSQPYAADEDDTDSPLTEEAIQSLGPIEKSSGSKRDQKNGISSDGPMPLHMEGRYRMPSPSHVGATTAGSERHVQPNTINSEINIINHTDVSLRMVAIDTANSGAKVERQLPAKSGDRFIAPLGCTISIIHPVTQKAVFRYKVCLCFLYLLLIILTPPPQVTDASTTLAVTDAALSAADEMLENGVGSSGKWYDNRVFMAAAGAGIILALLLVAGGIAFLVRYLVKRQKLKLAGGGTVGWKAF